MQNFFQEDTTMNKLRQRMIDDMNLAGLSSRTQGEYIRAVKQLVQIHNVSPDKISEGQVRQHFIDLKRNKDIALGTFQVKYHGIKFFFFRTLGLDWDLFTKKKYECRVRNVCPVP
jgi:hypothetical protein